MDVMWQQPPRHQFKNDKYYCCSAVWTTGNWQIVMKRRAYTCKATGKAWLGVQDMGEQREAEQGDSLQASYTMFSSVFTLMFHSVLFLTQLPIRQFNDNKTTTLAGLPTCREFTTSWWSPGLLTRRSLLESDCKIHHGALFFSFLIL